MSRIEELERRVQRDPASIAFGALAEEYRRSGRFDDAIAVCLSGLERHPSYLSARVTLGRALQALGRLDEARSEFERVIAVAPDNLAAIRALAELHGETDAAPAGGVRPPAAAPPDLPDAPAPPDVPDVPDVHAVPDAPDVPDLRARLALEEWLAVLERERASARERL